MLLSGCSNLYEVCNHNSRRNGRRVRSWEALRHYNRKAKFSEKPEYIMHQVEAEMRKLLKNRHDKSETPAYFREHYGFYTGVAVGSSHPADTSWSKYQGLFINGIKKAMTIDELAELGIYLYFHAGYRYDDKPSEKAIKSEREYFSSLKEWRAWNERTSNPFYLGFMPYDTDRIVQLLSRSRQKPPREKVRVEQDHYFVLSDGEYSLLKYTARGYRYSFREAAGRKYRTEVEAEAYRTQLIKKNRYKAAIWQVKRIDQQCTVMK